MKKFKEIVDQARKTVTEVFPWDVDENARSNKNLLLLDIREECEFSRFHIKDSMLVPRGILETACEAEYEDAVAELVDGREKEIVIICRSGNRSILAAEMMQIMGFKNVCSMQTGLRGWNDYELPLYDLAQEKLDPDNVEDMLSAGFCSTLMHPDRRTIVA